MLSDLIMSVNGNSRQFRRNAVSIHKRLEIWSVGAGHYRIRKQTTQKNIVLLAIGLFKRKKVAGW